MLKIALNPDAAYEICTTFAPDCERESRYGLNYNSSFNEDDYEEENESEDDNRNFLPHGTITNTINGLTSATKNSVRTNKIK